MGLPASTPRDTLTLTLSQRERESGYFAAMRRALFLLVPALSLGCSSSPPSEQPPGMESFEGGSLKTSCDDTVTTVEGATAPKAGAAMLGTDPSPYQIHLGYAGDPSRSATIVWRTRDDTTRATTAQYGTGGKTDQHEGGVTYA